MGKSFDQELKELNESIESQVLGIKITDLFTSLEARVRKLELDIEYKEELDMLTLANATNFKATGSDK
jgi:hypothetical protein